MRLRAIAGTSGNFRVHDAAVSARYIMRRRWRIRLRAAPEFAKIISNDCVRCEPSRAHILRRHPELSNYRLSPKLFFGWVIELRSDRQKCKVTPGSIWEAAAHRWKYWHRNERRGLENIGIRMLGPEYAMGFSGNRICHRQEGPNCGAINFLDGSRARWCVSQRDSEFSIFWGIPAKRDVQEYVSRALRRK